MTQNPVRRLTSDLFNKPHLISAEAYTVITNYLNLRNTGLLASVQMEKVSPDLDKPAKAGKIGIINIHGSLTNKPVESMCGATGTSYAGLLNQTSELINAGCKTIVLDISSGGGEAFNVFQTATAMRKMADDNGVYMISYVQDCAASAAYALCVASDEIVAHPQGSVGSIGVLVALMNDTKALEKEGLVRSFVTAGANKIPFDADGNFREEFISDIQAQIDELYDEFCEHVSFYTGLSVEDIKTTEASMYRANKALEMGLINSIMSNEEFADYLITK
jgi:ClpP class serine protease